LSFNHKPYTLNAEFSEYGAATKISPWLLTDDRNKRASFRASVTGRLIVTGIPTPRTQFLNPEEQQQQQQQQKGTRVWGRV
jgi:hypothetical protein